MKQEEKINNLENTPVKMTIRNELSGQTLQFIKQKNVKNFVAVTLPAKEYFFETCLENRIRNNFGCLKNIPSVQFHCAETDRGTMKEGLKNRPEFCTISNMKIEDLLCSPMHFSKVGIGKVREESNFKISNYNFLWADYCQRPTRKVLDKMIESIKPKTEYNGLYYFTFSLARKKTKHIVSELKYDLNHITIEKALEKYIIKSFKLNLHKTPKLIYSVIYTGGRGTPMITIGFIVGKGNITPIIENRKEKQKHLKSRNNNVFNRANTNPPSIFNGKKFKGFRQNKKYSNSNLTEQDKQFIILRYKKNAKQGKEKSAIIKKLAKAKRMIRNNINSHQIAAVLAWVTSSKLKAKAVN